MKLAKSAILILGAFGVLLIAGLFAFMAVWILAIGLFVLSRFSSQAIAYKSWTWSQFLVTLVIGVGAPYVYLLASAGF